MEYLLATSRCENLKVADEKVETLTQLPFDGITTQYLTQSHGKQYFLKLQ